MSRRVVADPFRVPLLALASVIALSVGGALAVPVSAAPAAQVTMSNELKFEPRTVAIKVGQTVEWRNDSVLVHTVTADPRLAAKAVHVALPAGAKPFNSGQIKPKATFRHSFETAGTYRYFCIPHEATGMVGEVVVTR